MKKPFILACLISLCGFAPNHHHHKLYNCEENASHTLEQPSMGTYKLDPAHASLIFRVNHLGLSHYTAKFKKFDATLEFDPKKPANMKVNAEINVNSLETDFPNPTPNFNAQIAGKGWLDEAKFPKITFNSTKVKVTGKNTAKVIGELSMHGIKHPMTLDVTYNGGYAHHPYDPSGSRIGFSARTSLKRSDFGITQGIPAKGSNMGVSDLIEVIIEAEFTKPVADVKAASGKNQNK